MNRTSSAFFFAHHVLRLIHRAAPFFVLILLILCPSLVRAPVPVHAQSSAPFTEVWFDDASDNTTSMAWGDYDGDGDLDLAVGNYSQLNRLYRNDGGMFVKVAGALGVATDNTYSVAWGDYDGDGDLDLAVGNWGQVNRLYRNDGGTFVEVVGALGAAADATTSVAWGDYDGDGDLDLLVGNGYGQMNRLYRNDGGVFAEVPGALGAAADDTTSIAWGDYDGDGDLDLVVGNIGQVNRLYRNNSGTFAEVADALGTATDSTYSVAWGDYDGDGDLDLLAGNSYGVNRLYRNDGGTFHEVVGVLGTAADDTTSVAWGDYDGDGDLDLAVGNFEQVNRLYRNDGGVFVEVVGALGAATDNTYSVAWGDHDGDGDLDLLVGNYRQVNRLYRNDGGVFAEVAGALGTATDYTWSVTWGDYDGDGDLDLVVGNIGQINRLYRNDGGVFAEVPGALGAAADDTTSIAWGDYDGDGDLDLVVGNYGQVNRLYRNDGGVFAEVPGALGAAADDTTSIAWGDYDGDGDLDLAVGNWGQVNRLYRNDGGTFIEVVGALGAAADNTTSVAWGDCDGDGDLDLLVGNYGQVNRLYHNDGGTLAEVAGVLGAAADYTHSVAWGDYDGDGDLDLVVGNWEQVDRLYRNDSGTFVEVGGALGAATDDTYSVAWGDCDGDGDLDLLAGNTGQVNRLYRNDGGTLAEVAGALGAAADYTHSVVWGDYDGDGDLDLAVGNSGQVNCLYRNGRQGGRALPDNAPFVQIAGPYTSTANLYAAAKILDRPTIPITYTLFDPEGDPIGHVAASYSLDGGGEWTPAVATNTITRHLSASIWDTFDPIANAQWRNIAGTTVVTSGLCGGVSGNGLNFNTASGITRSATTRDMDTTSGGVIRFALRIGGVVPCDNAESGENVVLEYSNNKGQTWTTINTYLAGGYTTFTQLYQAIPVAAQTQATRFRWRQLAHSGLGFDNWALDDVSIALPHVYIWDTLASGFFGQSDNVVLRLVAYPQPAQPSPTGTYKYYNNTPGPIQRPYASATTFPFRVRGTQVRVMDGSGPAANALIYHLPAGQSTGGDLFASAAGVPFRTDHNGYLQGRGRLDIGDRLFAMQPITWTDSYTLYHTSGAPTALGVNAHTVAAAGVQTLTVSAAHPLYLFNLDVSLEWDASHDPTYLDELAFNLRRASEYLYDFTNGQMALGQVRVFQNADDWAYTHIVVRASNRQRPFAAQGGIVLTDTVDPQHVGAITYVPGQVVMGSTWNRYGRPGTNIGEDWAIVLAHELSHYLLFHDDVYLGLDSNGYLVAVDTCRGSAMGDLYNDPNASEFIYDNTYWQSHCANTLAAQTLGRNEWQTMQLWYAGLRPPPPANTGPALMPFGLTTVSVYPPLTPTLALADPTFYLLGQPSSSQAKAFLLRDDRYVIDLGSPFGGQNRVLARGAQPGDRLCVFDPGASQFGCESIEIGDDQLKMKQDAAWNPVIRVTPVNSTTFSLAVEGAPSGLTLQARLYPEFGSGTAAIPLAQNGAVYEGVFALPDPTMYGHVQVWVAETATEENPRREVIVAFSVGGHPATLRPGGATQRVGGATLRPGGATLRPGGATLRPGGATLRPGGAPVSSPDGQMILYTPDTVQFQEGQFYAIQTMSGLPALPPGRAGIGQGYRLVATPGTPLVDGSVSIQYLYNDLLVAGIAAEDLAIYYHDGAAWRELNTVLAPYFNLASAPNQGPGIYALLASVQVALYRPGWNLIAYPLREPQPVVGALTSIAGKYTAVYGYEVRDENDPWKVYAPAAPGWANDLHNLEFGRGYWINATQAVTIYLSPAEEMAPLASVPASPPDTYYGDVLSSDAFIPLAGMAVEARIGSAVCGCGVVQSYQGRLVYVVDVEADDPTGRYAGCGQAGRAIAFYVGGQEMSPPAMWDNAQLNELALSAAPRRIYLPVVLKNK